MFETLTNAWERSDQFRRAHTWHYPRWVYLLISLVAAFAVLLFVAGVEGLQPAVVDRPRLFPVAVAGMLL